MGCLNSKESNDSNSYPKRSTETTTNQPRQEVPPIVITKAHSVASADSSLNPSTSAFPQQVEERIKDEKQPVIIEERTQEHQYGSPPTTVDSLKEQEKDVEIKKVKPIVIKDTAENPIILPATEIPEAKKAAEEAGILPTTPSTTSEVGSNFSIIVRLSNGKDMTVSIPTEEPYMTINELKSKLSIKTIKFIHLGRILKDDYVLVPSTSPSTNANIVKISNQGVIQAMVYQ